MMPISGKPEIGARNPTNAPPSLLGYALRANPTYGPTTLRASDLRHVDEPPGVRHVAARHLDQRRLVAGERQFARLAQRLRAGDPLARDAEAVGQPHEIRIDEVAADHPVAVVLALHVADIAVGAVVEHDHHYGNS